MVFIITTVHYNWVKIPPTSLLSIIFINLQKGNKCYNIGTYNVLFI